MSLPWIGVVEAARAQSALTPNPNFDHLQTPDTTDAFRQLSNTEEWTLQRARAERQESGDPLAGTERCDGCFVVSPGARLFIAPGVGCVCCDCFDLAQSPACPAKWRQAQAEAVASEPVVHSEGEL